ncbi:MAG: M28 family peptidase [Acidobacteriota bacterium]
MRRLILTCLLVALTSAAAAPGAERPFFTCAVVNIDGVGFERLADLKRIDGVAWWTEAGTELLLCGGVELPATVSGVAEVRLRHDDVEEDRLRLLRRAHDKDFGVPGVRVLLRAGRSAVVEVGDGADLSAPWHAMHAAVEGSPGPTSVGAALLPFERNRVLLRQAANQESRALGSPDPSVQQVLAAIDGPRWLTTGTTLAGFHRHTHGSGIAAARDWLVGQFEDVGLTVETPSFQVSGTTVQNVIATLPGTVRPDDWWIVGGHYDARTSFITDSATTAPGAEDNASGCSGVVELARVFSQYPTEETVFFACYAGEEQGLHGSASHALSLVNGGHASKIQGMLNMDMISWSNDAQMDIILGYRPVSLGLAQQVEDLAGIYTGLTVFTTSATCCSDHVPYIDRNMPAVAIYSNDWGAYPHYHEATDTADNLNPTQAVEVMKVYSALLAIEAGASTTVIFDDGFESGDVTRWSSSQG